MNIGEYREEVYAQKVNAQRTAKNTHSCDGVLPNGKTYEFKTLVGSKPSLGGKRTLQNQKNVRKAIENYLISDYLVIEITENNYLTLERRQAVEWLLERVTLSRASEKRGGWYKLRILKNPRTAESTATFTKAGFEI